MMQGVNVEATLRLAQVQFHRRDCFRRHHPYLDDVRALAEVAEQGIVGAITGRAIYEGTLDLG